MKGEETTRASLLFSAQSLFYNLMLEDQIAQTANGNFKPREELGRCKAGWKASEEEKKKFVEVNKKIKGDLAAVSRERYTFSKSIVELD